jgi:hypothetical protein
MARQNRWASFGQAFNAVYDVGTTIARDFEELQIRRKDDEEYKDAQGNPLTGLALDRAKMDALANIEQKYGDARTALQMRTGVEDLATAQMLTDYNRDTYDERVAAVGLANANTRSRTSLNNANAGLAVANTGLVGQRTRELTRLNDIGDATQESTILRTDAQNYRDANQANAQGVYYGGPTYGATLEAGGQRDIAQAVRDQRQAEIDTTVINDPNYLAGRLAELRRTASVNTIMADIASTPEFRQRLEAQETELLNRSLAAVENSRTDLAIAQNEGYQANRMTTGLAQGATDAANAQSGQLTAERELAINTAITAWSETADPNDPTSMATLVNTIKRLNPETGMALERNYGEHELWRITSNSLRLRAGANEALAGKGLPGLERFLEDQQFGGDRDAVSVERGEDGSIRMVARNPEGGTYVVAQGGSEEEFRTNLQGYLDPATMLEISKQQHDNELTRAQAAYYQAQANAKGTLSLDEYAVQLMQQGNPMGAMLAFRSGGEDAQRMAADFMRDANRISAAGGSGNGVVPNPADPTATATAPSEVTLPSGATTQVMPLGPDNSGADANELANARTVVAQALRADMPPEDRRAILEANRDLLVKYELFQPEMAKLEAADAMVEDLRRQDWTRFWQATQNAADYMSLPAWQRGLAASGDPTGSLMSMGVQGQRNMEIVQDPARLAIVIRGLEDAAAEAEVRTGFGSQNARNAATEELTRLRNNIAALQQMLSGTQTSGLGGGGR